MDATSLMQALVPLFACQIIGFEVSLITILIIILTASIAAIGAAGAPSAGIVMLVIVFDAINFPKEYLPIVLAIVLAIDRPLDMCRTVVNVTGDATVALLLSDRHR